MARQTQEIPSSLVRELQTLRVRVDVDAKDLAASVIAQRPKGPKVNAEWSRDVAAEILRLRDELYGERNRALDQLGSATARRAPYLLTATNAAKLASTTRNRLAELIDPINERVNMHHKSGPRMVLYDPRDVCRIAGKDVTPDVHDDSAELINTILASSDEEIPATEKQQLIKARLGQGVFRDRVKLVEHACRLTGTKECAHLRASHIKPWRSATHAERLDGNNGLMLAPHVDHLFDNGFISFEDDGRVLVSTCLDPRLLKEWSLDSTTSCGSFNAQQREYLAFHRAHVFRSKA